MQSWYKHGSWNVLCDVCGFKRKAEDVRKNWKGLFVCADSCWEPRHPQDFLRGVEEKAAPDFIRNEPEDTFTDVCWIWQRSAYAGLGSAGCMVAGYTTGFSAAQLAALEAGT